MLVAVAGPRASRARAGTGDHFLAASCSVVMLFGLAQAALVYSDAGRPPLVLVGGIACMNHLSYSLAISPDFSMPSIVLLTAARKAGSSLRTMMAMGSTDRAGPTVWYSDGFLDFEARPMTIWPSITKASARPLSRSWKLSAWSLPKTS